MFQISNQSSGPIGPGNADISNIIERFTVATWPGSQNGLSLDPGNRAILTSGCCDASFTFLAAMLRAYRLAGVAVAFRDRPAVSKATLFAGRLHNHELLPQVQCSIYQRTVRLPAYGAPGNPRTTRCRRIPRLFIRRIESTPFASETLRSPCTPGSITVLQSFTPRTMSYRTVRTNLILWLSL
jgi:hypothetical protein